MAALHAVTAAHLASIVLSTVVGTHLAFGVTTLRVATLASGTSHHWALLLLHEVGHRLKEHLEVELELFLVGKVSPFGTLRVLLTEELEIMLVFSSFVIQITNLFNLVMIDGHCFVVDSSDVLFC